MLILSLSLASQYVFFCDTCIHGTRPCHAVFSLTCKKVKIVRSTLGAKIANSFSILFALAEVLSRTPSTGFGEIVSIFRRYSTAS